MSSRLTEKIPEWMTGYDVASVAVTLIENAQITYHNGFGIYDGAAMTSDTIFSAQSLTKPMVAFLALEMIEDKTLALDTPLISYLETPCITADERGDRITARHVLSHSTGLPNWRNREQALTLQFEPGSDFNYSGEGYCYLQTVIEQITEQPLEQLIAAKLHQFGMSESYMATFTDEQRDHWFIKPFSHLNTNAAFSLMTATDDYARFLLVMLNTTYQSITEKMLTSHQQVAGKSNLSWGLGWGIEETPDGRYFWQWGAGMDERHLAIGNIDTQWAAVIMTSGNNGENNGLRLANDIVRQHDAALGTWLQWQDE